MAEVATTPQDVAPSPSLDDKIAAKLGFEPEAQSDEPSDTPEAATVEGEDGETLALEPEQEAEPQGDEVELTHNGQQVRVSKEQAKNLAQMGYDYNIKMQSVNADKASIQRAAQALQAQAHVQAQLLDHAAVVRSYDMQLAQYQGINWAQLAQADPIGASQLKIQYDALAEQRNGAFAQMSQAFQQHQHAAGHVSAEVRALETQKLQERVPQWKDHARYAKEAPEMHSALIQQYGYAPEELAGSPVLEDHRAIAILRDAWLYRKAVAAGKTKSLAKVPGVARPGAAQRSGIDTTGILQKQLKQSTDVGKKKAAFDGLLAKKLFG